MSTQDKNPSVVIREIENWIEQEMLIIDAKSYPVLA
jgi:hypothetical protein